MKTQILIAIILSFFLIGCSEIVNNDYADNIPASETAGDPYTWTLLRFNSILNLLPDSVKVDVPSEVVTAWEGNNPFFFPLNQNNEIHIIEPISVGYKMIQDSDTTAIDSIYINVKDAKITKWRPSGMTSTSFVDITASYMIYTSTY